MGDILAVVVNVEEVTISSIIALKVNQVRPVISVERLKLSTRPLFVFALE